MEKVKELPLVVKNVICLNLIYTRVLLYMSSPPFTHLL